jgi:hypothetical protein
MLADISNNPRLCYTGKHQRRHSSWPSTIQELAASHQPSPFSHLHEITTAGSQALDLELDFVSQTDSDNDCIRQHSACPALKRYCLSKEISPFRPSYLVGSRNSDMHVANSPCPNPLFWFSSDHSHKHPNIAVNRFPSQRPYRAMFGTLSGVITPRTWEGGA